MAPGEGGRGREEGGTWVNSYLIIVYSVAKYRPLLVTVKEM